MTDTNRRGSVRKNPDPVAIATRGRTTTYEGLDERTSGAKYGPRPCNVRAVIRRK